MTPEQVRYTPEAHTTRGWKTLLMNNRLLRLAFISLLIAQATPSTVCAQTNAAPPLSGRRYRKGSVSQREFARHSDAIRRSRRSYRAARHNLPSNPVGPESRHVYM